MQILYWRSKDLLPVSNWLHISYWWIQCCCYLSSLKVEQSMSCWLQPNPHCRSPLSFLLQLSSLVRSRMVSSSTWLYFRGPLSKVRLRRSPSQVTWIPSLPCPQVMPPRLRVASVIASGLCAFKFAGWWKRRKMDFLTNAHVHCRALICIHL